MIGMHQRSSSRPWRSSWTQSIGWRLLYARSFSSRRRFSSKRARCLSWRHSRRAPSVEVRGDFPSPCAQRPHAPRLMSRDTSSGRYFDREPDLNAFVCRVHISRISARASQWRVRRVVGQERARSRWCFSAPSPHENPTPTLCHI